MDPMLQKQCVASCPLVHPPLCQPILLKQSREPGRTRQCQADESRREHGHEVPGKVRIFRAEESPTHIILRLALGAAPHLDSCSPGRAAPETNGRMSVIANMSEISTIVS